MANATVSLASAPGSKTGQGDNSRSQEAKDSQGPGEIIRGCWLWQLTDPAALEDHFYNIHRDKEFLEYKTLSFVRKRMIVDIIESRLALS